MPAISPWWNVNNVVDNVGTAAVINSVVYLKRGEVVVDEEGQTSNRHNKELHPERVVVAVIGRLELGKHQVDGGNRA